MSGFFTEAFMESCIAENPEAFFGRGFRVSGRQESLFGFFPDLILEDGNDFWICEIQKDALDRTHLYKTLEYRDNFSEKYGIEPRMMLVCNEIEERYRRIVATHQLELRIFDQADFIRKAVRACPASLEAALLADTATREVDDWSVDDGQFKFPTYQRGDSASVAFRNLTNAMAANGIAAEALPYPVNEVFTEISHALERHRAEYSFLGPKNWNLINLRYSEGSRLEGVRRPSASLSFHVTSQENLSVRIHAAQAFEREDADWIWFPDEHPRAFHRPPNEILFIKHLGELHPGDFENDRRSKFSDAHVCIASDLIGIAMALVEEIASRLSTFIRLEWLSGWEIDAVEVGHGFSSPIFIRSWEIFDKKQRELENDHARYSQFLEEFGVTPAKFADLSRIAIDSGVRDVAAKVGRLLTKETDVSVTDGQVRSGIDLLRKLGMIAD